MLRPLISIFFIFTPFILTAQGYFYTESTVQINTGASIEIKGDAVINQSIDGDGFMVMNGDNPQNMGGSSANMNNLRVTNSADVLLTDPIWVNDTLDMASGIIYLQDQNVYLADNSFHTGNLMGYLQTNGSGYIQRKLDTSPFTFHVGFDPEYFPVTLTEMGTADTFRVQAWDLLPDDGTSTGIPLTTHVGLMSYSVNDIVAGGNLINITMQWNDTKNAVDFVQPYAVGIRHNGSNYVELDNCPTNVSSIDPNIVSYAGIPNIGTFGVGDSIYLSNIPYAFINPGDTTVCLGSNVTFTATPAGAPAYLWSTSALTQSINATAAGNYWVEITDITGCVFRSEEVTLDTLSLPVVPTIIQTGSQLSVSAIYTTYQWYFNSNPIGGATSSSYTATANGTYDVVVTNANGCSSSDTYIVVDTGLEEENTSYSIYNQQGQLYIQLGGDEAQQVFVYDALGKVVYQEPFNSNIITLELSSGIYVVRVIGIQKEYVKKLVW